MPLKLTTAQAKAMGLDIPKASKRAKTKKGKPAVSFEVLCHLHNLPDPEPEYKFHPCRKWRFDFAWRHRLVALECDGAVWTGGRHTRGKGFIEDQKKRNAAAKLGWKVLHCTPADIKSGAVFALLREVLG